MFVPILEDVQIPPPHQRLAVSLNLIGLHFEPFPLVPLPVAHQIEKKRGEVEGRLGRL